MKLEVYKFRDGNNTAFYAAYHCYFMFLNLSPENQVSVSSNFNVMSCLESLVCASVY